MAAKFHSAAKFPLAGNYWYSKQAQMKKDWTDAWYADQIKMRWCKKERKKQKTNSILVLALFCWCGSATKDTLHFLTQCSKSLWRQKNCKSILRPIWYCSARKAFQNCKPDEQNTHTHRDTHTHRHTHTHTHTNTSTHRHIHTHTHRHTHIHRQTHTHTDTHTHTTHKQHTHTHTHT